ncbi:Predicted outer membrane protein [Slackia heliotrinireducens]|nr:Predicted outer membrane protein [Slackia heliotrinireducens]
MLEGRDLKAGEFSFTLTDDKGNVRKTVTNAADGSIDFGMLLFEHEGTYTYTVAEVKGDDSTITYDESVKTFTVEVVDEGGQLVATASCEDGEKAVFTNKYTAPEPDPTPDPKPKPEPEKPVIPKTGDDTPITGLGILAVAAVAVIGVAARRKSQL